MDVVTAYLARELEEKIYMVVLDGILGVDGKVYLLKKGLYGLK